MVMDLYRVLGVSPDAEEVVIKASYYALMRKYHPDQNTGPKEEADRKAKELNAAYEILGNAQKRAQYDRQRSQSIRREEPTKEKPSKEKPSKEEPAKEKPAKEEPAKEKPGKEKPEAATDRNPQPSPKSPAATDQKPKEGISPLKLWGGVAIGGLIFVALMSTKDKPEPITVRRAPSEVEYSSAPALEDASLPGTPAAVFGSNASAGVLPHVAREILEKKYPGWHLPGNSSETRVKCAGMPGVENISPFVVTGNFDPGASRDYGLAISYRGVGYTLAILSKGETFELHTLESGFPDMLTTSAAGGDRYDFTKHQHGTLKVDAITSVTCGVDRRQYVYENGHFTKIGIME